MFDKLVSTFIWQKKRPRVRLKTLPLGGLALPNFKSHYWAAQINAIVAWIENDQDPIWTQLEQSSARGVLFSMLPCIKTKSIYKIRECRAKTYFEGLDNTSKKAHGTRVHVEGYDDSGKQNFHPQSGIVGLDGGQTKVLLISSLKEHNVNLYLNYKNSLTFYQRIGRGTSR